MDSFDSSYSDETGDEERSNVGVESNAKEKQVDVKVDQVDSISCTLLPATGNTPTKVKPLPLQQEAPEPLSGRYSDNVDFLVRRSRQQNEEAKEGKDQKDQKEKEETEDKIESSVQPSSVVEEQRASGVPPVKSSTRTMSSSGRATQHSKRTEQSMSASDTEPDVPTTCLSCCRNVVRVLVYAMLIHIVTTGAIGLWLYGGRVPRFADYPHHKLSPLEKWSRVVQGEVSASQMVPSAEWIHQSSAAWSLFSRNTPMHLYHTPADTWQCQQWSPAYLKQKISTLRGVHVGKGEAHVWKYEVPDSALGRDFFPASSSSHMSDSASKGTQTGSFESVDMSTEEFFAECDNHASESKNVYYAGDFGGDLSVLSDVGPPQAFFMDSLYKSVSSKASADRPPQKPTYFAWIGKRGTAAHCHTDAMYNFYIQLYGRKRFLLFHPSLNDVFHRYPKLHPSTGQSQIDFLDPDTTMFPEFLTPEVQDRILEGLRVVELGPGDVLYIPPHWMHYVEALDTSISVSLWVPDHSVDVGARLHAISVPLRGSWDTQQRAKALALFVIQVAEEMVLSEIQNMSVSDDVSASSLSVKELRMTALIAIATLLDIRYRPMCKADEWDPLVVVGEPVRARNKWISASVEVDRCDLDTDPEAHDALGKTAKEVVAIVNSLSYYATKKEVVWDYIEEISALVVGAPAVYPILAQIVTSPTCAFYGHTDSQGIAYM